MGAPDLHDVMARLPHLSATELTTLSARVKALQQVAGNAPAETTLADTVLETISEVLRGYGVDMASAMMMKRSHNFGAFSDKIPGLTAWMDQITRNRIEQRAVLTIAVDLLYQDLKHLTLPITGRTMMNHIHRIPAVMDASFPGYAKYGLLRMLIRR